MIHKDTEKEFNEKFFKYGDDISKEVKSHYEKATTTDILDFFASRTTDNRILEEKLRKAQIQLNNIAIPVTSDEAIKINQELAFTDGWGSHALKTRKTIQDLKQSLLGDKKEIKPYIDLGIGHTCLNCKEQKCACIERQDGTWENNLPIQTDKK